MCGIVGIWSFREQIDRGVLNSMNQALAHRGPDDSGLYMDEKHSLGLGHSRLSILDLSSLGHQPMSNDNKTIWTSFNGEIYNFKEIRRDLINKGHIFTSNSDTEVIVKSYEQWGIECIHRFRGMFAIAIWDKNNDKLYLIRDRAGVKPLYYYFNEGLFLFGSELKALMKHPAFYKDINHDSIQLYLRYGYIPAPHSIFKNTYKLNPGYYLCVTENKIEKTKYWEITDYYQKQQPAINEDEIIEELEEILVDSFKYRLVSDVPIGVFLSGGIDSSILTALLARSVDSNLKTFSIGFNENSFNEAEWAKKVANYLSTNHTEYYLSADEGLSMISDLPEIYDEPFGDNSALPTYLLSKITRNDVKVALSADGGDELFCGYKRYYQCRNIHNITSKMPKAFMGLLNSSLMALSPDFVDRNYRKLSFFLPQFQNLRYKFIKFREMLRYSSQGDCASMYRAATSYWMTDELDNIILSHNRSSDDKLEKNTFSQLSDKGLLSQMMMTDFKYYLADDILTKLDRASMSVGLEARDPFLDQNIIEYAAGIPADLHYKNGESKYLLRRILYKYVPKELLDRPKQGFSIPLQYWLREELNEMLRDYLSHERIKKGGIFNSEAITRLVDDFINGSTINVNSIWCILMFEMWKERWLPH